MLLLDERGGTVLKRVAAEVQERVRSWRTGADDDAVIEIVGSPDPPPGRVMSPDAARRVVDMLVALPSGVLSMDERLPGIVRTSTNLGVAYIEDDDVVLVSAPRSSRQIDLRRVAREVRELRPPRRWPRRHHLPVPGLAAGLSQRAARRGPRSPSRGARTRTERDRGARWSRSRGDCRASAGTVCRLDRPDHRRGPQSAGATRRGFRRTLLRGGAADPRPARGTVNTACRPRPEHAPPTPNSSETGPLVE